MSGAAKTTFTDRDESQSLTGAPSGIGATLGKAQRGIPDKPVQVRSWPAFVRFFGSFLATSDLAFAAKRALESGVVLWISRVVHRVAGVSSAVAATKTLQTSGGGATAASVVGTVVGVLVNALRTFAFATTNQISLKSDGGGTLTATLTGAAASKSTSNSATFVLANGNTINYRVGGASEPIQNVTFATGDFSNIAAATPAELATVLARDMAGVKVSRVGNVVTIATDQKGTGARLEFTSGTALAALGLSVEVLTGTGNVADLQHVTITELDTLIKAATTNAVGVTADASGHAVFTRAVTGASHSIQFVNGGAADAAGIAALGIPDTNVHSGTNSSPVDTITLTAGQYGAADPGVWGNDLTYTTSNATKNPSTRWKLVVKYKGSVVDTQDELSMDPADDRYFLKVLANHPYLLATDLDAYGNGGLGSYITARPAAATDVALLGGDDGGAVVDADYIGDSLAKTGLYAFDAKKDIGFLGAPGITSRTFNDALGGYCKARADVYAVLDGPANLTTAQKVDYRQATGSYTGGAAWDNRYGAIWWNRLKITDPVTLQPRFISLMGDVFAAFANARIDSEVTPAGAIAGPEGGRIATGNPVAVGLEEEIPIDGDGDTLADYGMNFATNHATYGLVFWGERNLQAVSSDLDRIPQVRWHIYARQTLKPLLDLFLFQPDDEVAWKATRKKVAPWLRAEIGKRAIKDANFVNDDTVNTSDVVAAHRMRPRLFVKHNLHTEFIEVALVAVSQDTTIAK